MKKNSSTLIDSYFSKLPKWSRDICSTLREAIHKADPFIQEDWKWGQPCFTYEGRQLCFVWPFAHHVNFTFFLGALMEDPYKLFNSGENNLRSRAIKFTKDSQIDEQNLIEYIQEGVALIKMGKTIKIQQSKDKHVYIPKYIEVILKDEGLFDKYNEQIYTYRKGYVRWIDEAKHEQTKQKRIGIMLKELHEGTEYMGMKR